MQKLRACKVKPRYTKTLILSNCFSCSDVKPEMDLLTLLTVVKGKEEAMRFMQNHEVIHQQRSCSNGHRLESTHKPLNLSGTSTKCRISANAVHADL